jgi:uncharacterized protein YuzE
MEVPLRLRAGYRLVIRDYSFVIRCHGRATDTLTIVLSDSAVLESDEDKPGIILDYDSFGNLVSLGILDASRRVSLPSGIEYKVTPVSTS